MTAAAAPAGDAVEVGRVVDAWGVKGWIKVQPFSADPQALLAARSWQLRPPESAPAVPPAVAARAAQAAMPAALDITSSRRHGEFVVAQARELADRNAAEALKGARVFVSREHFPRTGDDEFYWIDLIGLSVVNREGQALGVVSGLIDTGPHAVLRVQPAADEKGEAEERMIPFVAAYIDEVSLERRLITVDWGLDY